MSKITVVSAMSSNYVIGHEGKIPFDVPEDRAFFRNYCRNKTLVVGYKTFLGLPKMPDVQIYVLTNNKTKEAYEEFMRKLSKNHGSDPYYRFFTGNLEQLKDLLRDPNFLTGGEIVIGGGQKVYETFIPFADQFIITKVNNQLDGDTKFPVQIMNYFSPVILRKVVEYHSPDSKQRGDVWWTRTSSWTGNDGYKRLLTR